MYHDVDEVLSGAPAPIPADDAGARRLLQQAQGAFQKWPEGFAGFTAIAHVRVRARAATGIVAVHPYASLEADFGDPECREAVAAFVARIVCERTPCFFKDGDGRFPVTFDTGDGDHGARRIIVHSPPRPCRYRIDATGRLRE